MINSLDDRITHPRKKINVRILLSFFNLNILPIILKNNLMRLLLLRLLFFFFNIASRSRDLDFICAIRVECLNNILLLVSKVVGAGVVMRFDRLFKCEEDEAVEDTLLLFLELGVFVFLPSLKL